MILYTNIVQTLMNSLHRLLKCEIGVLDCQSVNLLSMLKATPDQEKYQNLLVLLIIGVVKNMNNALHLSVIGLVPRSMTN